MSDNVNITSGSGTVIATEEVGGAHYQYVKLAYGAADAANLVTSTTVTPLPVISAAVHVDDAAFTLGTHSGVMVMGYAGTQTVDANDATALACDTSGRLLVSVDAGAVDGTVDGAVWAAATNEGVGVMGCYEVDPTSLGDDDVGFIGLTSTRAVRTGGDVAHDTALTGNPVPIAARATASVEGLTEVAANDASYIATDLSGVQITRTAVAPEELVNFYVANTDGAEDAVTGLDAGGATIYNYITSVTIYNAHASTNASVRLLDGTGGAVFWEFPAPATGGTTHNFDPPLKQPTVNTALYVDPSAAVTTIGISIAGYQGQG